MLWSEIFLSILFFLLRVRVEYRLGTKKADFRPVVVIGNHRHDIDALLFATILHRLGCRSYSGVAKIQLGSAPVVGRCLRELGFALVARNHDPRDRERVREFAEHMRVIGGSCLIFPEGTTYIDSDRHGSYVHLLVPKTGGMQEIHGAIPEYPILSVTVHWGPDPVASTVPGGEDIIGRKIIIETTVPEDIGNEDIVDWLNRNWAAKDRRLIELDAEYPPKK